MTKKVSVLPPRKSGRSVTDEKLKARIDEQHEKKLKMIRQFRAEHEKNVEVEKSLKKMHLLSFEPVDYGYLLEVEPWVEPPLTSYEHLKSEAVQRVETLYKNRLMQYAGSFAASFFLYMIFSKVFAFVLFLAIGVFLVYQTSCTLKQKQDDLISALEEAQQEIYRRQEAEKKSIEEARKQYEFSQQLRQEEYQSIVEGKAEIVGKLLKEKLEESALPVNVTLTTEINGPMVNVSVLLPDLSVIPKRRTRLLQTGYIEYEEKEDREVYKQYRDLVTALLLHISVRTLEAVPTVCCIYIRGMNQDGELLMYMKITRELLEKEGNRIVMAQFLKNIEPLYSTDNNFKLVAVEEPGKPTEWDESQPIHEIAVKLPK